ncbi:MAG: AbrB/MazE/SpoVT family DNA-binding domain-containing protein [Candidatus Aenigmarchaeota archaeon]|nr:AbrB/MazE/SpoVT family DNA-binding domain-containing protein [Candidatus Aenigmarchaeota archaeon]
MNVFTEEDLSILNKMQFFTAKPDNKGRLLIPAAVRRILGIKYNSKVLLGLETDGDLSFFKRSVDSKGRVYFSLLKENCLLSVESLEYGSVF